MPTKNAWSKGPVCLLESSIDTIIRFFTDIVMETQYSFDKILEKFECVQNYVTSRDGV